MKQSRREFESSLTRADSKVEYSTEYVYEISDRVRDDVIDALANLKSHLPYVLAFNERIRGGCR